MIVHTPRGKVVIAGPTVTYGHMQRADGSTLTDADLDRVIDEAAGRDIGSWSGPIERHRAPRRPAKPRTPRPRLEICQRGHPMEGDNIGTGTDGNRIRRFCRECRNDRERARRERKAASRPPKPRRTHCSKGHPLTPDNLYLHPQDGPRCRTCRTELRVAWARRRAA